MLIALFTMYVIKERPVVNCSPKTAISAPLRKKFPINIFWAFFTVFVAVSKEGVQLEKAVEFGLFFIPQESIRYMCAFACKSFVTSHDHTRVYVH